MKAYNNENERTSNRKERKRKKKGFTLIELMIVLGLIAVLIGFMVPKMAAYKEKALETKAVNTAKQMENAVITCYSTNKAAYEDSNKLKAAVKDYTGKEPESVTVADDTATVVFTSDKKKYAEVINFENNFFTLYKGSAAGEKIYTSEENNEEKKNDAGTKIKG